MKEAFTLNLPVNVNFIRIKFGVSITDANASITMYLNNIMLYGTAITRGATRIPTTDPVLSVHEGILHYGPSTFNGTVSTNFFCLMILGSTFILTASRNVL